MKLTNNLGLPIPIATAILSMQGDYENSHSAHSDISVTTLIKPPQILALEKLYSDQLEEDIGDMGYAMLGSTIHVMLERSSLLTVGAILDRLKKLFGFIPADQIVEKRFYKEIDGWTVSGQVDYFVKSQELLQDYKVMSVWESIFGLSPEKEAQLNILSWLVGGVQNLEIVAIFRDWQQSKVNDQNYPKSQMMVIPVEVWSMERTEKYIIERIGLHRQARAGNIPACTDEERWYTGTKYAVMKGNNKRAVKLCETSAQAYSMAQTVEKGWIEKRPGVSKRCASYCSVGKAGLCNQFNDELKG